MRRLDTDEMTAALSSDGRHLIVGSHEHPSGVVFHTRITLSSLPNDLVSLDDLIRFGIDLV
jgi:hypothetical protein